MKSIKPIPMQLRVGETKRAGWWLIALTCEHDEESPLEYFVVTLRYRHDDVPHRFVVDQETADRWKLYHDTFGYDAGHVWVINGGVVITDSQRAIDMARYVSQHPSHWGAKLPESASSAVA